MKKAMYVILLIGLMACQEEQVGTTCLEPPCGAIDPERFNMVLAMKQAFNISDIVLDVNGAQIPLIFGINPDNHQFLGCWNHSDIPPGPSLINTLTYKLNGEQKSVIIEVSTIVTNAMVIEFKENKVLIYDYEPCDDTPVD